MILNSTHRNELISPARSIAGRVELYNGSTLLNTFNHTDALSSFTISRAGDKKFFGFGVSQEIEVKLVDRERLINIEKEQNFKISFIANGSTISPTPRFYIAEVNRDENTNELTVKAYDVIHNAKNHTVSELNLKAPYTITDVVSAIVGLLGVSFSFNVTTRDAFNTEYPDGANFDGAETLREVLDAIAEATQTIYYINNNNALTFKHLDIDGDPVLTVRKADYFTLESKTNRTLSSIVSATELGDNVEVVAMDTVESKNLLKGVPENYEWTGVSFFENVNIPAGTYTFSCESVVLGDGEPIALYFANNLKHIKIYSGGSQTVELETDETVIAFYARDFNYALSEDVTSSVKKAMLSPDADAEYEEYFEPYDIKMAGETQYVRDNPFWELREDIATLLDNAIALVGGITLNQFTCKWRGNYLVEPGDKIALVTKDNDTVISYLLNEKYIYNGGLSADTTWEYGENESETANNPSTLGGALKQTYAKVDKANKEIEIVAGEAAAIKITTNSISQSVSKMDDNITELTSEVSSKMTAEEVSFSIQTALDEGVERVITTTGFTFNEEGLHVSRTDSEITTSITEDGMTVYKNDEPVLIADNLGVKAEDLHATTYLIVGNNSRFEDYGNRTGCFWIGN